MSAKKETSYKGLLARPIPKPNTLNNEEERSKIIDNERLKKLPELYKHYGIIPSHSAPLALVLALANQHVPGFSVENKKTGRPSEFTGGGWLGVRLFLLVQQCLHEKGFESELSCIPQIIRHQKEFHGYDESTLWRRYMETKEGLGKGNNIVAVMNIMARGLKEKFNLTDQQLWDDYYKDFLSEIPN